MIDRFACIIDALVARAHLRFLQSIDSERFEELILDWHMELERAAEAVGYHDALNDGFEIPEAFQEDKDLRGSYRTGLELADEDEEWRAMNAAYPSVQSERPIFCPHGHNVLWTTAGWDECGACGAIMTAHAQEDFDDALVSAGQLM